MKKRIRLHQLRVGMFLDGVEGDCPSTAERIAPFLISSADDLTRLSRVPAISVIIDTVKGVDIDGVLPVGHMFDSAKFEADLNLRFSQRQIRKARKTLKETRPFILSVLTAAHASGSIELQQAECAVERVMSEALTNPGALLGVVKLKNQDEATFLHCLAVSALMITFARKLNMDEALVRLLGLGGVLHDLGKVTLPSELLRKPGKLTDDDMALIRLHPERGYDLLAKVPEMPQEVLEICLHHHEKYDGSGYPHGLRGSAIPYLARLAAICDVYDALTTVRPYKRAWTKTEAIATMRDTKGHFDPELLAAFVSQLIGGSSGF